MKHFFLTTLIVVGTGGWCLENVHSQDATELLKRVDMNRGVCCVLGAGDGSLPLALAKSTEMLIHVRDSDTAAIEKLRKTADETGYPIQRMLVETGALNRLPHAENMLDLVISNRVDILDSLSTAEVLRALRPDGIAIFGGKNASKKLKDWAKNAGENLQSWSDEQGDWIRFSKPVPKGLDEWSHWEKAPDNNPVSNDVKIKAPYMTQFMARPWYIGMPAVTTVAGGRTFLAMGHIAHHQREWDKLNRIIARNGYNGTVLWERKLPEDYLVHRSAFIASKDTFYMINGDHCLMLDAKTGEKQGEIKIPGFPGDWKWIALQDGILYALAGKPGDGVELVKGDRAFGGWSWGDLSKGYYPKRIPHGFGDIIAAYDVKQKKTLWTHKEKTLIDSRGLAIRDDQFYIYCPDRHFRGIDCKSGKVNWTNGDKLTMGLIEEPGKGLVSTPGWRTQSLVVATPDALVVQGQTRMNVVGISTKDGSMLWQKSKFTNNPNAIYVDGKVILAVGERGSHIVIDPKTGTVEDDLKFYKRVCTRLTASTDSFFVRGEGMTRFDRESKVVQVDGAVRPACNDGVIPANGLIYLGPWACDCNLSLIGNVARCSAGDFRFDLKAIAKERLEAFPKAGTVASFEVSDADWPTYRGNLDRSASTRTQLKGGKRMRWHFKADREYVPTAAVAAGDLIFLSGEDGKVRAIEGKSGKLNWSFQTGGPVKYPPTIAGSRAYVGSGDGFAYCLEAASGRLLWRFRASPVERRVMIYGSLSSTWPVNTGILEHEGVVYFGAGIVDHDGTYIYALDAKTGEIIWENNSSGHLNAELRKGVSAQGNLTILDDMLVMAGGNAASPATFSLKTGECLETARKQGQPQSNGGKFIGVLGGNRLIAGGRILYSSPRNVSTKGSFEVWSADRRSDET